MVIQPHLHPPRVRQVLPERQRPAHVPPLHRELVKRVAVARRPVRVPAPPARVSDDRISEDRIRDDGISDD
jgi:hypothetical protein